MQDVLLALVDSCGYWGIFLLILIENVFPPIPSEAVLLFGGALTVSSTLNIPGVVAAATGGIPGGRRCPLRPRPMFAGRKVESVVCRPLWTDSSSEAGVCGPSGKMVSKVSGAGGASLPLCAAAAQHHFHPRRVCQNGPALLFAADLDRQYGLERGIGGDRRYAGNRLGHGAALSGSVHGLGSSRCRCAGCFLCHRENGQEAEKESVVYEGRRTRKKFQGPTSSVR